MIVAVWVAVAMLAVAAVLLVVRITRGPTTLDRAVALDVLVAAVICGLGMEAAINRHTTTLPILVALALIGFVGSVTVARFTRGADDTEAEADR